MISYTKVNNLLFNRKSERTAASTSQDSHQGVQALQVVVDRQTDLLTGGQTKQSVAQKACDGFPVEASASWCWEWPGSAPLQARSGASGAPEEKSLADPLSLERPILCPRDPTPRPAVSAPGAPSRVLSAQPGAASRQDRTPTVAKDAAKWRGQPQPLRTPARSRPCREP